MHPQFSSPERRQPRTAVVIGNTKENIAAAQVVEVIGKSAQGVQNSLRIPAAFKLKPLPLHRAAPQHFMYIDRRTHILQFVRFVNNVGDPSFNGRLCLPYKGSWDGLETIITSSIFDIFFNALMVSSCSWVLQEWS